MKIHFKFKLILIVIIFVIFAFLFPCERKYGYNTHTEDKGPDVSDTSSKWYFTYYSDGNGGLAHTNPNTNSNFVQSDWSVNETYGWHEWEYNGTKYVVMAAATCEYLDDLPSAHYPFLSEKDNIHYFHYGSEANNWNYSTFQFKFVNNGDTNTYNGIVLDTCEMSIDPSNPAWDTSEGDNYGSKPENTQWLDVHVELGYPEKSKYNKFNGQEITLTSTGVFSSNAGTKSSTSTRSAFIEYGTKFFSFVGDFIQVVMDFAATDMSWTDSKKLTYSKSDIEADDELKDSIQVEDSSSSSDTSDTSTEKKGNSKIRTVDISSSVDSRKGEKETVYSASTEIPVMPIDIYSSAIDIVDMFDTDFFSSSSENTDKFWNVLRSVTRTISHMVMYISAALILSLIIWRTILLVKSSLGDEPEEAYGSKKIMDDLVRSVLIISFVYFIMIILMNFYKEILKEVLKIVVGNNESIYLIKVNVDGVYSFNTNIIGYIKYLSLTTSEIGAFGYSILYALMQVFGNLSWFMLMFVRTVLIAVLIMIAPLAAVYNMINRTKKSGSHFTNILDFRTLMKLYVLALFIPLVGIVIYKLILVLA